MLIFAIERSSNSRRKRRVLRSYANPPLRIRGQIRRVKHQAKIRPRAIQDQVKSDQEQYKTKPKAIKKQYKSNTRAIQIRAIFKKPSILGSAVIQRPPGKGPPFSKSDIFTGDWIEAWSVDNVSSSCYDINILNLRLLN
jgi:hypothetical protein